VATDPRRFQNSLSFAEALQRSRTWWKPLRLLNAAQEIGMDQACSWMEEFRLGRKRLLDTYLAATYHEKGIRRLVSSCINKGE